MGKICRECKLDKSFEEFCRCRTSIDAHGPVCKSCRKLEYQKNKKRYIESAQKRYRAKTSEVRSYIASHRDKNRDKYKENAKRRMIERRSENISVYLKHVISNEIGLALKKGNATKAARSIQLLGCSIDELKIHLENQFTEGMSWENYGRSGWHIDHIKPCASFDLSKPEEQRKCFHYTNLQPLWWRDNIVKGSNYNNVKYYYVGNINRAI